jgi:hypothetical protein
MCLKKTVRNEILWEEIIVNAIVVDSLYSEMQEWTCHAEQIQEEGLPLRLLHRLSDRRLLTKLVSSLGIERCRVVSLTDPLPQ